MQIADKMNQSVQKVFLKSGCIDMKFTFLVKAQQSTFEFLYARSYQQNLKRLDASAKLFSFGQRF